MYSKCDNATCYVKKGKKKPSFYLPPSNNIINMKGRQKGERERDRERKEKKLRKLCMRKL